jgi:hypothetical protein
VGQNAGFKHVFEKHAFSHKKHQKSHQTKSTKTPTSKNMQKHEK